MKNKLLIIAGEDSGDMHGSALINELKLIDNTLEIFGIGGDRMIASGMTALYHIKDMSFLGFAEVVKHIPFIKRVQNSLLTKVKEENIKEAVLIDYPGFNLSLSKKLKKLGVKIIYYISPQIWAWGKNRIHKIKKLVDLMIVVFPFEKNLYKNAGVKVEYIGHPLIDRINSYQFLSKQDLFSKYSIDDSKEILLIMPGSRKQEILKIFPETIKAAKKLSDEFNFQTVVACSQNIDESLLRSLTKVKDFIVTTDNTYDFLKYAKFGIIKSGTSTLEAGIFKIPFIVVYVTNFLTYLIGKTIIKLESIALVNIVAGEKIVDELIQNNVKSAKIYETCKTILTNKNKMTTIKNKLEKIKSLLGNPGASQRAAALIYNELNEVRKTQ